MTVNTLDSWISPQVQLKTMWTSSHTMAVPSSEAAWQSFIVLLSSLQTVSFWGIVVVGDSQQQQQRPATCDSS
jgi:hypothetical protein